MSALNLTFLSIFRIDGKEWPLIPGLLVQNPPKKTARGREADRLFAYLALGGNVSFSSSDYDDIAGLVADTFYNSSGSLTFAMKTAAEALNNSLVDRNMKSTGKGLYSIGALVLCCLRGNQMFILQSGNVHVFHFSGEIRHLYDPQLSGKGLGLGQPARMYFSQILLASTDRMLICTDLPANWDKSIQDTRSSTSLEMLRRRLLAITDTNVSALLVQAQDGNGEMVILNPIKDVPLEVDNPVVPALVSISGLRSNEVPILDGLEPESEPAPAEPVFSKREIRGRARSEILPRAPEINSLEMDNPEVVSNTESEADGDPYVRPTRKGERRAVYTPETRVMVDGAVRASARKLAELIQAARAGSERIVRWAETAIVRMLPENELETTSGLVPRSWSIIFAAAIPIIFFVVARVVYFELGYDAQYQVFFNRAQQAAQQAQVETAPSQLRVEWQSTLDWLDKADQYSPQPKVDAQNLRQQAQTALDGLDRIVRIKYQPAFSSSLSKNLQITRMAASNSDLFLLDSTSGSVLRGVSNGQTYDLDESFQCGAGVYDGGIQVGKLIDTAALVRTANNDASVLGMDGAGKLLYCIPGKAPLAVQLTLPGTGWQSITAIAYDSMDLYVLDAAAHAVWVYPGDEKIQFGTPQFFFGTQVPVMMENAIGLAVNGDDLYLLYKDGHMTICTMGQFAAPTRCNDPALYIDTRPGYEGGMKLSDGIFSQIFFTNPPDPAVMLLEPFTQSIFHFSPRSLEMQNQIQAAVGSDNPLPKGKQVTAMAFSPNKILFIFVDGQVYSSTNVP